MVLPFPPQQLALLPILFQVQDGKEELGLRTLEVKLMPELARGLGVEEWSVGLSLSATGQPKRLRILGPGWNIALRVERLEYATELPSITWQAPENAIRLDSQKIQLWINEIDRQLEAHRPTSVEKPKKSAGPK